MSSDSRAAEELERAIEEVNAMRVWLVQGAPLLVVLDDVVALLEARARRLRKGKR